MKGINSKTKYLVIFIAVVLLGLVLIAARNILTRPDIVIEQTEISMDEVLAGNQILSGSFIEIDRVHKGSGQATIYRGPDGSYLLRIEDLKVTNGPDLHIFLSPHPNPTKLDELLTFGAVDLGKLKGNIGNQNYVIPEDVDVNIQMTVVIYCVPFHVFFSIASLGNVG